MKPIIVSVLDQVLATLHASVDTWFSTDAVTEKACADPADPQQRARVQVVLRGMLAAGRIEAHMSGDDCWWRVTTHPRFVAELEHVWRLEEDSRG